MKSYIYCLMLTTAGSFSTSPISTVAPGPKLSHYLLFHSHRALFLSTLPCTPPSNPPLYLQSRSRS